MGRHRLYSVRGWKRMSYGLRFSINYTWSHFLDDLDSSGWGAREGFQTSRTPSIQMPITATATLTSGTCFKG